MPRTVWNKPSVFRVLWNAWLNLWDPVKEWDYCMGQHGRMHCNPYYGCLIHGDGWFPYHGFESKLKDPDRWKSRKHFTPRTVQRPGVCSYPKPDAPPPPPPPPKPKR